jgi:acyl dehydratase
MAKRSIKSIEEMRSLVGSVLGRSRYVAVTQEMIDSFANLTGDQQWIHVDRERAADGPFGTTVVHGYLTLSLGPMLAPEIYELQDAAFGVNYGADRLRFPAPLRSGANVCLEIELLRVEDVGEDARIFMKYVFWEEGAAKPCCVAEVIVQYFGGA